MTLPFFQQFNRLCMTSSVLLCAGLALGGLSGCMTVPTTPHADMQQTSSQRSWQGVMQVQIQQQPPQTFSGAFEVQGGPEHGQMQFSGPFGITLAHIHWSPGNATLQHVGQKQHGGPQHYSDLASLLHAVTGAALPVHALFDWLDGRASTADGWQVDVSQYATNGSVTARRIQPAPTVQVRVVVTREHASR